MEPQHSPQKWQIRNLGIQFILIKHEMVVNLKKKFSIIIYAKRWICKILINLIYITLEYELIVR